MLTTAAVLRADLTVRLVVWTVWVFMMLAAFAALARYGRSIPLAEDWLLVAPLTGHEPSVLGWLWEQNNEHRIPFPRLVLLGLLKVSGGDFRAGMAFNIACLGVLAVAMIRVARSVRGGAARYVDAVFPLTLLHLGHRENLFSSWQVTQVLPTVLSCIMLLVFVRYQSVTTPAAAVIAAGCLLLLPLSGANGLVFVPFLALWLAWCGAMHWRSTMTSGEGRWRALVLLGAAIGALSLAGLYFVAYVPPQWSPPSPGIGATLRRASEFLGLSIGSGVRRDHVVPAATVVVAILLASAVMAVRGAWQATEPERQRSLAILVFLAGVMAFALAMGWGRAGLIELRGRWPSRYVLMGVPALFVAFFIWELYGPTRLRRLVQGGLLLIMCVMLPLNTREALRTLGGFDQRMSAVEADIAAGVPHTVLAERHRNLLIPWWEPPRLAERIKMLQDAGMSQFADARVE